MTGRDVCGTAAIFGDVSWKEEGREKNEDKECVRLGKVAIVSTPKQDIHS